MQDIYISGTGVWTPPHKISNDELRSYISDIIQESVSKVAR